MSSSAVCVGGLHVRRRMARHFPWDSCRQTIRPSRTRAASAHVCAPPVRGCHEIAGRRWSVAASCALVSQHSRSVDSRARNPARRPRSRYATMPKRPWVRTRAMPGDPPSGTRTLGRLCTHTLCRSIAKGEDSAIRVGRRSSGDVRTRARNREGRVVRGVRPSSGGDDRTEGPPQPPAGADP